jgi:type I restriction-modification system DNA methylase subunit
MCVIRRMDAVLEPTKSIVLDTKKMLDEAQITEQRAALCDAAGQAFYNASKFTLRDLKLRAFCLHVFVTPHLHAGGRDVELLHFGCSVPNA